MSNDVVLTAALRNNLLSLQRTQSSIDITQLRLATGKKVNSALDNPQNFFASNALKNRASDLNRLLDGLGQNIQVIKAADHGVTALTKLVEQADSVAQSARDSLAQGQAEAKLVGDRDLRNIDDLTGLAGIGTGDQIVLSITNTDGNVLNVGTYGSTATAATMAITIDPNESIEDIITEINDIHIDNGSGTADGVQAFEAKLDASGRLQIRTLNGGNFSIEFQGSTNTTDAADLALASDLGFSTIARLSPNGAGGNTTSVSAIADAALTSFRLFENTVPPSPADRSDLLANLTDSAGNALFAGLNTTADNYIISINGGAAQRIDLTTAASASVSIQDFIDDINNNAALNTQIRAEFDDETRQIVISAISPDVESIEIGVESDVAVTANFGFGVNANLTAGAGAANMEMESIRLGAAAAVLAELEVEFDNIRDQIDQLVSNGDTGYRGTNLLFGDNLTSFFNEFRSSSLETEGVTFTADGLGLGNANFSRVTAVDSMLADVRAALEQVRNFGGTLANDLAIVQTRQDYTKSLINTLTEGSDLLVNADQNEEGAKLLALQTRQSLGVTSLSLASQSQQAILRLF
jgi:flagellin-like hook-associated protein FlgL